MKILILVTLAIFSLTFFSCSEDSSETPPLDQNTKGKLLITSTPSGAQIYLNGMNTGKATPGTIENLDPGNYDGFLFLQYYDTAYFSAVVYNNTTTTIDTTLEEALPFVEFQFNYQMGFGGDSVRFSFTINQDVTMDSILVQRPIDVSGNFIIDKYPYSAELFEYQDQFRNPLNYYLPPPQSAAQYYQAIQSRTYYFSMFGHKVHGSKAEFRSYYQVIL